MSALHRALVEPARPVAISCRPTAYWYVVGTVCLGAFMGQLDASIVTLALPSLASSFHVSVAGVEWVSLSYLLTLVSTVTAFGRTADIVGRKLLYVYGFGIFVLGSALCGFAPDLPWLIAARVLQALGAAMLQANSVALIVHAMPAGKLGRALGIQGAAQALGLAAGPVIGGVIVGLAGWRLIFFVNVPIGILGMALGWFLLPRSRDLEQHGTFDWVGTLLFVPAAGAMLLALSEAARVGWVSREAIALAAASVAAALAFTLWERRVRSPLVDLALFRRAAFSAGISSGLLAYLLLFGALFIIPFYLVTQRHHSTVEAGLELAALPIALGIMAPIGGRATDRFGTQVVATMGMGAVAVGCFLIATVPQGVGPRLTALAIIGAGLGCFIPANNAAIMTSAPKRQSGMAGGVINLTRGLGTALGIALAGLLYATAMRADAAGSGSGTQAFVITMIFLATVALAAAAISTLQSGQVSDPATIPQSELRG